MKPRARQMPLTFEDAEHEQPELPEQTQRELLLGVAELLLQALDGAEGAGGADESEDHD